MEPRAHPKMLPVLILLSAVSLVALVLLTAPGTEGATIVVPDDYAKVQYAIDNASAGDVIRVHAGTYIENLVVDVDVDIIGNGTSETTIRGNGPDVVEISTDGVNISKMRIENGGTSGIVVRSDNVNIEDVYVTGCSRGLRTNGADWLYIGNSTFNGNYDYGMLFHLSSNITVHGCTISDTMSEDGILVNGDQGYITISSTTIETSGTWGLDFFGPNWNVVVDGCTIANNSFDGVFFDSITDLQFTDNTVNGNTDVGLFIFFGKDLTINGNMIYDNSFGVYLANSDGGEIGGNTVRDNDGLGIGLYDSGGTVPFWVHHNKAYRNGLVYMGVDCGINIGGFTNSDSNIIEDNEVVGNHKGIVLMYSGTKDNIIRRNIISDSSYGVENYNGAGGNVFYHNTFINNTQQVRLPNAADKWNSAYPNGGNYWDTYSGIDSYSGPAQDVRGADGLGDTPYMISTTVKDSYPLIRVFGDNPLASVTIVSPADGSLVGGIVVAEAVVSGDWVSMVEWYLDGKLMTSDMEAPYQFVVDTTKLAEDGEVVIRATAVLRLANPISHQVKVMVNNAAIKGDFVNVTTVRPSYMADDRVTAIVGLISPPAFDQIELHASYTDDMGTMVQVPVLTYPDYSVYGLSFWLGSDVPMGNVSLAVEAWAFLEGSLVWTSDNTTLFAVDGGSHHDAMAQLLEDLTAAMEAISGLNATNQAQLANALTQVLDGMDDLDTGLQARMDELEGSIATNSTALLEYIDLQTEQVQLYMAALNDSIAENLAAIRDALASFRANATGDLAGIAAYLEMMEANGSTRHGEVLDDLEAVMASLEGLNASSTLDELRDDLLALRDDLSAMNDSEAARHANTVQVMLMELDGLATTVNDRHNVTDAQLGAMDKLDTILEDLHRLSSDVSDLKESDTGGQSSMYTMLLVIVFGLFTLVMLIILVGRVKAVSAAQPTTTERPPTVAPLESDEGSFELSLMEPEMYPEDEGPEPQEPEPVYEPLPEVPPPPSFKDEAEAPEPGTETAEVPPPELYEVEEITPQEVIEMEEYTPEDLVEEVPPPPPAVPSQMEAPEVVPEEPAPEIEEMEPEGPAPEIEEPEPEELEPTPEEIEEVSEGRDEDLDLDLEPEEPPHERPKGKSAQEWVLEEISREI